jgi:hypothetical protein
MRSEKVKNLKAEEFKRLCCVKLETFEQMVLLVRNHDNLKTRSGRPSKLSVENQVLMTLFVFKRIPNLLSYWAELGH